MGKMKAFEIYHADKLIDTVFYDESFTANDVYADLYGKYEINEDHVVVGKGDTSVTKRYVDLSHAILGVVDDRETREHSIRVSENFAKNSREYVVALLHDVVEDEDNEIDHSTLVSLGFDEVIVDAVFAITRQNYIPHKGGETYAGYIDRVSDNEIARRVKIEDIKDNLFNRDPNFLTKSHIDRYTKALNVLLSRRGKW